MTAQSARVPVAARLLRSEEFSEPDFELLEQTGEIAPKQAERVAATDELAERDRTIDSLTLRLIYLQGEMEEAASALRARESEVDALRRRLTSPSAPPPTEGRRVGWDIVPAGSVAAGAPLEQLWIRPRRAWASSGVQRDFRIELEFHDETRFFAGLNDDLAEGGLFVATYERLAIGTEVSLALRLSDGTELELDGIVAWLREQPEPDSERPGMGVMFLGLPPSARDALERIATEHPPLYVE